MFYDTSSGELKLLENDDFTKEKTLQTFVEENIEELLGLKFVATEFWITEHDRADTIAYDEDSKAFIIIEDKKIVNRSLVDQGYAYLAAMLDRKEKFVLRYNTVFNENKDVNDFDWSQSRIIFISPEYTRRQLQASSFDNMPFKLMELKKYGDMISWKDVTAKTKNRAPTINDKGHIGNSDSNIPSLEYYSENDILEESHPAYEQYVQIHESLLDMPDVEINVKKSGIKFTIGGSKFCEVDKYGVTKSKFFILLVGDDNILDPEGMLHEVKTNGRYNRRIEVNEETNVDDVLKLLEQSYSVVRN